MKLDWEQLNQDIYHWDGSWRDIYIADTKRNDWKNFVDFVNRYCEIQWYNEVTKQVEERIDFDRIEDFWENKIDWNNTAKIFLNKIQINAHFFTESEIECDIDPREFNKIEDHEKLMEFLSRLSLELDKPISIVPENCPEIKLIEIDKHKVSINWESQSDSWPLRIK